MKDKTPTVLQSGLVYKATCPLCGEFYVGKTYRHFCTRMDEHLRDQQKVIENSQPVAVSSSSSATSTNGVGLKSSLSGKITKRNAKTSTDSSSVSIQIGDRRPGTRSQSGSLPLTTGQFDLTEVEKTCNTLCNLKEKSVCTAKSAISKHYLTTGHVFTSNDFEIVLREKHRYKLLVKESLVIRTISPVLNGTDRSVPLYVYSNGIQSVLWARKNIARKGSGLDSLNNEK
ncbi:unnamed protein product [Didymodactylos carnosus]|uniref:Uncharacterized protein n=1 Tax=Didymodactylos carnosus TaxID=1234261 RepID=A0A815NZD2_9BILA|nr:unnamed protein product [Didymodactylos carnosus]CAF1442023.1 unnamed protein product [Didymodactylos carnosus]CAF3705775.1 unnamed protein product [Didymodactylos carnosus]CAF4317773.1 unnamed protein product [Didymodactylos carnosus]